MTERKYGQRSYTFWARPVLWLRVWFDLNWLRLDAYFLNTLEELREELRRR